MLTRDMMAVFALVFVSLQTTAFSSAAWSIIAVPASCNGPCSGFPAVVDVACATCLLGIGAKLGSTAAVPTWNRTSQTTLPRLPVYEAGYTNVPAVTLLFPSIWISAGGSLAAQASSVCALLSNQYETSLKFIVKSVFGTSGLPPNVTICQPSDRRNCSTHNFGDSFNIVTDGIHVNDTVYKLLAGCCNCTPTTAELEAISALLFSCVETQGWLGGISGMQSSISPCPLPSLLARLGGKKTTPFLPLVPVDAHFNSPEQLALPFTTNPEEGNKFAAFGEQARAEAIGFYTNVTDAADSLWRVMHNAWAATLYLRKPKPSEEARLEADFGVDWEYATDLRRGALYEMDLATWQKQFSYELVPDTEEQVYPNVTQRWNVGAHVLFHRIILGPDEISMRAIAIRLNGLYQSNASEVYTIHKSPTAFILAMAAARSSLMAMNSWVAHNFHYHVTQSAMTYALYHTIEPSVPFGAAKHPVRLLLDSYLDPFYLSGFTSAAFAGLAGLLPSAVPIKRTLKLYEAYALQGPLGPSRNTLWSMLPFNQLKRSNLDVAEFTSHGGKAWDLYPLANFQTNTFTKCRNFVEQVVTLFYKCDAEVATDAGIQALAKGLVNPHGANLRQFSATNKINTREALADFAAVGIYNSVIHSVTHLQDYTIRLLSQAHLPLATSLRDLPDAHANYTMQDLLLAAPSIGVLAGQLSFANALINNEPWARMVTVDQDGRLDWTVGLPFSKMTPQGRAANRATVAFRKELSVWLDAKHDKYLKVCNTNFGPSIARVSPFIDI